MNSALPSSTEAIAEFCRRHHVRRLSLFGSVLREDFRPDSDVDVLIDFQPGHSVGFEIMDMEQELSRIFGGRRIDLINEKYLNPRLRGQILATHQVQYAEK